MISAEWVSHVFIKVQEDSNPSTILFQRESITYSNYSNYVSIVFAAATVLLQFAFCFCVFPRPLILL